MSAPAPSFFQRLFDQHATVRGGRGSPYDAWTGDEVLHRVEVAAPDPECAALFVEYASSLFPAEITPGAPATVRLHPSRAGTRWVVELLALVERWLEAVPLSSVNLTYGGRDYLVRSSTRVENLVAGPPRTATLD